MKRIQGSPSGQDGMNRDEPGTDMERLGCRCDGAERERFACGARGNLALPLTRGDLTLRMKVRRAKRCEKSAAGILIYLDRREGPNEQN
jgi:hypothetical protein